MIRVGLYTQHLDEFGFTGPNVYLTSLIHNLSLRKDIELHLIHCFKNKNKDFYKNFNNILIPKFPLLGDLVLRKYNLDIIHFNYIPWEFRSLFFVMKQKKIATSHISVDWNKKINWENHSSIRSLIEPLTAKHLDKIISVSNNLKFRLINYLNIPASKIEVVYEAIDRNIFKELKKNNSFHLDNNYNMKNSYIIHVSNFSIRKNPILIFKTFKRLIRNGYKGDLLLVGFGWRNNIV